MSNQTGAIMEITDAHIDNLCHHFGDHDAKNDCFLFERTGKFSVRSVVRAILALKKDAALPVVPAWQPIETAPEYTEVLCWREDQGVFISQLTVPGEVVPDDELERMTFPEDFKEWFNAAWGWQEGSERPTHWMPLPAEPSQPVLPVVPKGFVSKEPTQQMLYAMAAMDGYRPCDRDMPGIQRWRDYWDAAMNPAEVLDAEEMADLAAPSQPGNAQQEKAND